MDVSHKGYTCHFWDAPRGKCQGSIEKGLTKFHLGYFDNLEIAKDSFEKTVEQLETSYFKHNGTQRI